MPHSPPRKPETAEAEYTWADVVAGPLVHLDKAAVTGGRACFDPRGSAAVAAILRAMASKLDRLAAP